MMEWTLRPLDRAARAAARGHWDSIAKPLNSLGMLEEMVSAIAGMQGTPEVDVRKKCVLVFCADNGVVEEGVSQSASEVTALVARSLAEGTANVNAMARVAGADVVTVDVGMLTEVEHPGIVVRKCARGTRNMAKGPAMTREQALRAVGAGMELVGEMKARGYGIIATGEMGIGNTTTSSAMAAALLSVSVERMTGRGAGLSDQGLRRKVEVIRRALEVNRIDASDPLDVLAKVGGFDIAGMAGAFLGGAKYGVPVVVDGFISGVAALTARRLLPGCEDYMLASHASREPAASLVLEALGLQAPIQAGLALGEGTGAVALFPLLEMALAVYNQSHTFEDIHLDAYERLN